MKQPPAFSEHHPRKSPTRKSRSCKHACYASDTIQPHATPLSALGFQEPHYRTLETALQRALRAIGAPAALRRCNGEGIASNCLGMPSFPLDPGNSQRCWGWPRVHRCHSGPLYQDAYVGCLRSKERAKQPMQLRIIGIFSCLAV